MHPAVKNLSCISISCVSIPVEHLRLLHHNSRNISTLFGNFNYRVCACFVEHVDQCRLAVGQGRAGLAPSLFDRSGLNPGLCPAGQGLGVGLLPGTYTGYPVGNRAGRGVLKYSTRVSMGRVGGPPYLTRPDPFTIFR